MFRVSPEVFDVTPTLIQDHPVFHNNLDNSQAPVRTQLATTLYRVGHSGNGASLKGVVLEFGIPASVRSEVFSFVPMLSEGS